MPPRSLYVIDGRPYGVPAADDDEDGYTVAVYGGERYVRVDFEVGEDEAEL